jgi:hypothetical protein
MVGRLEDADFVVGEIERRNHQPRLTVAESALPKGTVVVQRCPQGIGRVLPVEPMCPVAPPEAVAKYAAAGFDVEPDDLTREHPQTKPNGDNAPRGSSSDEVEMIHDPDAVLFLQFRQHGSGVEAANASTIERKNLKTCHDLAPTNGGSASAVPKI